VLIYCNKGVQYFWPFWAILTADGQIFGHVTMDLMVGNACNLGL